MKQCELFVGRFQPLHKGHSSIISKMENPVLAIVRGTGTSMNKERNPFNLKEQIEIIKTVHPQARVIEVSTGYIPDIILALQELNIDITAVWRGQPKRNDWDRQIDSYNKENPDAQLNVETKCTFDEQQGRVYGASATQVREAIVLEDQETFQNLMPEELHSKWQWFIER